MAMSMHSSLARQRKRATMSFNLRALELFKASFESPRPQDEVQESGNQPCSKTPAQRARTRKRLFVDSNSFSFGAWGSPKILGTFLKAPIIRTIIFLDLCWGPFFAN